MHVHLTSEYSKTSEIDDYKLNEGDVAIDGVVYAAAHVVSRLHHRARSRRRVSRVDLAAQCHQRRQGAGPAHRRRRQGHRQHRRPRRPHQRLGAQVSRRSGPGRRRHQQRRGCAQGRAPALQGRLGHHQDHRDRRRAVHREERRQPAVHRRRNPRRRQHRARLRLQGGRARARRRRHQARGARRRRHHRARHVHGRRGHQAHEGARHVLRADDFRRAAGCTTRRRIRTSFRPSCAPRRCRSGRRSRARSPRPTRRA